MDAADTGFELVHISVSVGTSSNSVDVALEVEDDPSLVVRDVVISKGIDSEEGIHGPFRHSNLGFIPHNKVASKERGTIADLNDLLIK